MLQLRCDGVLPSPIPGVPSCMPSPCGRGKQCEGRVGTVIATAAVPHRRIRFAKVESGSTRRHPPHHIQTAAELHGSAEMATPTTACAAWLSLFFLISGVLPAAPADAQTIDVPAGGNLQSALDRARPGDTVALAANATFTGNFVLPRKDGDAVITLRTAATSEQPSAAERVRPDHAPFLAKIKSPNDRPAIATAPGAHHWRLELLEFQANAGGVGDIVT